MPFECSICAEESTRICARCTKDACNNHLCEKCLRCSDCCECEVTLSEPAPGVTVGSARSVFRATHASNGEPDIHPRPPQPPPDPDPDPDPIPGEDLEPPAL